MNYLSLISSIKNSRVCFIGTKDPRLRLGSLSPDKTHSFVLYTLHNEQKYSMYYKNLQFGIHCSIAVVFLRKRWINLHRRYWTLDLQS